MLYIPGEASRAFDKLLTVLLKNSFVIYQIDSLYEHQNELNLVTEWFNVFATHLPRDPSIL